MSDEERKDEETEVEGHGAYPPKYGANQELSDELELHGHRAGANDEGDDEVEGHGHRAGANDEADDEVEGHGHRAG